VRILPRVVLILVSASIVGCVTLAPEAEQIKVTREAADVKGCKILGTVEAHPPYVGQQDGMNQMRNNAAGLGANILFVTSYNVTATGMAYLCGG
jgi:Domain of unknown function (DUF4156)